jgi:hypothetical protein
LASTFGVRRPFPWGRGIAHGCLDDSDVRWHQYPKWNDGLTLLTTEKPKSTIKSSKVEKKPCKFSLPCNYFAHAQPLLYTTNTGHEPGL